MKLIPYIKRHLDNTKFIISFLLILIIIFICYWTQIRPSNIKSSCADFALIRGKAKDMGLDEEYHSQESAQSYNDFIKDYYKNNEQKFVSSYYNEEEYNTYFSRCLHEHGI